MAKIIRAEPEPLKTRCISSSSAHNLIKFDDETMICTQCGGALFVKAAQHPVVYPSPCTLPHLPCTLPHYPQPHVWWGTTTTASSDPTIHFKATS